MRALEAKRTRTAEVSPASSIRPLPLLSTPSWATGCVASGSSGSSISWSIAWPVLFSRTVIAPRMVSPSRPTSAAVPWATTA
jgi:hypothetical protein